ncbi:polymorphic outer membrane protein middle domain-containing protein [Chlamydia sp. 17-3921]|uniref:polymorphic outer membrane protein middle domain-containing protein n=1 Tax=Chlamydia sp. 17-3921 TaxID=2675798 RepID=UPI00191A89D5|nr:polymorphic outer membrane protein middle domain-containing protein [Chlamydia sp. 17-3921]
MKSLLYQFLITSSFVFPFSLNAAITSPLGESFDGLNGGTSFSKITDDASGVVYNLERDVSIANIGSPTVVATTSCFQNNEGNTTFLGNWHSLSFINLKTSAVGAAVNAAKQTLLFSGFSKLFFTLTAQKGAIKSIDSLIFEGNYGVFFDQNTSSENGGAINAEALIIRGTRDSFSCNQNKASKGGAIAVTKETFVTANSGLIYFLSNSATGFGGAIFSEANTTISGNSQVIFNNNSCTGNSDASGGAIYCSKGATPTPLLTIIGNKNLSFLNNMSKTSGGAIYADKLILSSGGPTLFLDNSVTTTTTPKGGAIAIKSSGEIGLTANGGDIVFAGNMVITNSTTKKHNAIDVDNNGKFTNLRALEGRSIYFYDPVTMTGTATPALNINQADTTSSANYNGTIVFSGEKLTKAEANNSDNLTSIFKQAINISSGTLVLKDGVTVKAQEITQTPGSQVVLDIGTTLEAEAKDINLNKVAININSLEGTTKSAVIKTSADNKTITLRGPITFIDSENLFYENHDLFTEKTYSLLQLSNKGTGGTITLTDVPDAPVIAPHYGYQGTWKLSWADSTGATTPKTKTATVKWTQTGYNPNPERVGSLVPNSLWGACVDLRSLHQLMSAHADSLQPHRGFWFAALGNFFHKDKTASRKGFRHISTGYALGTSKETLEGNLVSIAFSELFCREKDYLASKINGRMYSGSLLIQHIAYLDNFIYWVSSGARKKIRFVRVPGNFPMILESQLTYGQAHNSLKTSYTHFPQTKGNWKNHNIALEGGASVPIFISENGRIFQGFSPFARAQLIYNRQNGFKEKGTEARRFDDSHLTCFSLPMGLKFEKLSKEETFAYDISVTYIPDIIRSTPDCTTTLLVNNVSWDSLATNLSRHALALSMTNHYSFNSHSEFFSQTAFEWRSSSRNYTLDIGCKIHF